MTLPTLHIAHKDSPETVLAVAIDDTETTLVLDDTSMFEVDSVTRLTLGIDTPSTETVTVVSYEGGPSGDMDILVVRGTPAYSWPIGTLIARVFTSYDLDEVHEYLEALNTNMVTNGDLHDHAGGDGAQIPTAGIVDANVTADKLAADAVTTTKILDANVTAAKLAADAVITAKILDANVTAAKLGADAVTTVKILNDAVTPAKIPNRTRHVFLPAYKFIDPATPTSVHYKPWSSSAWGGIMLPPNLTTGAIGIVGIIPSDYVADGVLKPIMNTFLGFTTGYHAYLDYKLALGRFGTTVRFVAGWDDNYILDQVSVPGVTGEYVLLDPTGLSIPVAAEPADIMTIEFLRLGDNVLDTYPSNLLLRGFLLTYTADS